MGITNLINPIDYMSVQDDLWHVAESDTYNYNDYKYVFDVYVNNVQLIRAKIYPNPSNGKGYFNVSNVVSNTMKFDWFNPNGNLVSAIPNNSGQVFQEYILRVGEEYDGVTYTNLSSGTIKVANCTPNLVGRQTIYSSASLSNISEQFITSRDRVSSVGLDEDFSIGVCIPPFETNDSYIEIVHRNVGQLATVTTLITASQIFATSSNFKRIAQLNIGPKAINKKLGSTLIGANTEYYEINIRKWNGVAYQYMDTIKIYIDCKAKYQSINLHFMNNYGVFDTARFNLASRLNMDAERKTFEQSDYRFKSSSVDFFDVNFDIYGSVDAYKMNESKINFGSKYQWTYKLTMDFPSDIDYNWLDELIMSPQIWAEVIVDSNAWKEYYPVSLKANNYEYSKHINNRLRAFEVEIDMNQKRNGFRR